mmetsp:Transcript_24138/g.74436  ORF Transcript_24138/g.74436 Transcript_24138/m.74436 type:complete len:421 (+) Transcript_24138:201-1463(+)
MAGLWNRLRGVPTPPARRGPDPRKITGDVFADADYHDEDLEPELRGRRPKASPSSPPPAPRLPSNYVASSPQAAKARQAQRSDAEFAAALDADELDLPELRRLAWNGVPPARRGVVWRCLLGCSAPAKADRARRADERRAAYRAAVGAALLDVPASERSSEDGQMLRQILVDAPRTCPGVPLFAHDRVQALIVNVLYVWAAKHPASGYVQGMNDLLALFLVVLVDEATGGDGSDSTRADPASLSDAALDDLAADAYACLNGVLESLDDNYTIQQPGLARTIEEVDGLIRRVDADLRKHLDAVGVLLLQVTFRWINCLLTRELPTRAAVRLWDTCLAEEHGFRTFFPYVCAAFLCHFSETLRAKTSEDVHLFLTDLPTAHWGTDEVETLLSEAYILSTLFKQSPAHLQHEPDGITATGGFL